MFRTVKIFCMIIKPKKCTTPRVNPQVNYVLGIIKMHQCRFVTGKNVDSGRGYSCVGAGGI